jgi:hypothetical protein
VNLVFRIQIGRIPNPQSEGEEESGEGDHVPAVIVGSVLSVVRYYAYMSRQDGGVGRPHDRGQLPAKSLLWVGP